MSLKVYYSSICGNLEMNKKQQRIFMVLDGKKVCYDKIDIAAKCEDKDEMRRIAGDPTALPPQICNGDVYCGDFSAFECAVEDEQLDNFLKLCQISQTKST